MKITTDTVVSLIYNLRYDNAEGELVESIEEKEPMEILIGHEVLLETFEQKIADLSAGDKFDFTLTPEEAYGEYDEEKLIRVPKAELLEGVPEDGIEAIFEGNIIPIVDDDEITYEALIVGIEDDIVSLDFNHPLAGETLHFTGKILSVRLANQTDIQKAKENA